MRQAFVLTLGAETDPRRHYFVGFIEEVDTGRELRFKSTEELLEFLAQCFEAAEHQDGSSDQPLKE
jgi:hypothetical protein